MQHQHDMEFSAMDHEHIHTHELAGYEQTTTYPTVIDDRFYQEKIITQPAPIHYVTYEMPPTML
jgi:hypothetical protein